MPGLLQRLSGEAAERLRSAYAPRSQGPLNTALRALGQFARACPERELFIEPQGEYDRHSSAHNEWTFILLATFLASRKSKKTGRHLKAKTIESYISLLKGYLSFSYDFEIVQRSPRLKHLLMSLRNDDPLDGIRGKRRGMRRRHLRRIWKRNAAVRGTDPDSVNNWAMLTTAWHILARGGEVAPGVTPGKWTPTQHPTRGDLFFGTAASGQRYAVVWLRPLKKKKASQRQKVPQYILEHDGGGSDTYAALRRLERYDPVHPSARDTTPLFRRGRKQGGRQHASTSMLRTLVKTVAASIGLTRGSEWGAHSMRIGGATDLVSTGKASQVLLQAKGRWASDICQIYARMTRKNQLAASALMQTASGRDLEEILPSFTQMA